MDLGAPFSVMTPTLDAPVLQALARTDRAMTAPQLHRIMGRGSYNGIVKALRRLVGQGLLLEDRVGATYQYRANRDHLAWPPLHEVARLGDDLESRIRAALAAWQIAPKSALLFGSAARRDGDAESDVDILLVSQRNETGGLVTTEIDNTWDSQKLQLAMDIRRWTGNSASILEVTGTELAGMIERSAPIVDQLRRDALVIVGPPIRELLGGPR